MKTATLITLFICLSIGLMAQWTCGDSLQDSRDLQLYKTVQIGTQCWMAQNLNYGTMAEKKHCYNDLESYCDKYGGLYNWDDAMNNVTAEGSQGICPEGWHIPSYNDAVALLTSQGGINVAGAKLKDASLNLWESAITKKASPFATNSSGFSGTPTGTRWNTGQYKYIGSSGLWWTSSYVSAYISAYYFGVGYYLANGKLGQFYTDQAAGVRCVKN